MDLEQIRDQVKAELSTSRYQHSLGVEEVACDMAAIFGYPEEKAKLAGLLHDCAKCLTDDALLQCCKQYQLPVSQVEQTCPFLLHGKVGAAFAKNRYGVEDTEILTAIEYHTTGRPGMTLLEKIIFTADYIEPNRKASIPRMLEIRQAAYSELDQAVYMILENMLHYLEESSDVIDTLTVDTFEYYKRQR